MSAVAPRDPRLVDELEVRFVDEARGRQRGAMFTNRQLPTRDESQVLIHDGHERIE